MSAPFQTDSAPAGARDSPGQAPKFGGRPAVRRIRLRRIAARFILRPTLAWLGFMSTRFVIILSLLAIAAIVATRAYRAHSRQSDLQARALAEAQFQNDALAAIEQEARQMLVAAATAAVAARGSPDQLDGCGPAFQEVGRSNSLFAGLTAFDL